MLTETKALVLLGIFLGVFLSLYLHCLFITVLRGQKALFLYSSAIQHIFILSMIDLISPESALMGFCKGSYTNLSLLFK